MTAFAPPAGITFGVMARAPVAARCKTRLARGIGDEAAAALYRAMLLDTLDLFAERVRLPIPTRHVLLAAPEDDGVAALRALAPARWDVVAQRGEGLGPRLLNGVADLAGARTLVCLVDSDSPTLPPEALATLAAPRPDDGIVVGPCDDGGYYLVGMFAPEAGLFEGIPWSTPGVLDATRRACASLGRPLEELATWHDIDDAADLERLAVDLARDGAATRTAEVMRELARASLAAGAGGP